MKVKVNLILIVLILGSMGAVGQTFKVNLSPSHDKKLSLIKSGHKRMMKYYKFYKKDSVKHLKKVNKQARKTMDSLVTSERKGERLKEELSKRGINGDKQWQYADSIQQRLKLL